MRAWTELIWLGIGTGGGQLWMHGISWLRTG